MADEYTEVERLRDQLELAKACEVLEEARDDMHANRNEDTLKRYNEESQKVADLRVAFREKYPPPKPEFQGDAVATPESVSATGGVHQG